MQYSLVAASLVAAATAGYAPPAYAPAPPAYEASSTPEAPVYSTPAVPVYGASSTPVPVYSTPEAPVYSAPVYSTPEAPVYSTPEAPVYSTPEAPVYSTPEAPQYTTAVVTQLTTYCPSATKITYGTKTYTVTAPTTLTITDYPVAPVPTTYGPPPVYTSAAPPVYSSVPAPVYSSVPAPYYPSANATVPVVAPTGTGVAPPTYTGAASKLTGAGAGLAAVFGVVAYLLDAAFKPSPAQLRTGGASSVTLKPAAHHLKCFLLTILNVLVRILSHDGKSMRHSVKHANVVLHFIELQARLALLPHLLRLLARLRLLYILRLATGLLLRARPAEQQHVLGPEAVARAVHAAAVGHRIRIRLARSFQRLLHARQHRRRRMPRQPHVDEEALGRIADAQLDALDQRDVGAGVGGRGGGRRLGRRVAGELVGHDDKEAALGEGVGLQLVVGAVDAGAGGEQQEQLGGGGGVRGGLRDVGFDGVEGCELAGRGGLVGGGGAVGGAVLAHGGACLGGCVVRDGRGFGQGHVFLGVGLGGLGSDFGGCGGGHAGGGGVAVLVQGEVVLMFACKGGCWPVGWLQLPPASPQATKRWGDATGSGRINLAALQPGGRRVLVYGRVVCAASTPRRDHTLLSRANTCLYLYLVHHPIVCGCRTEFLSCNHEQKSKSRTTWIYNNQQIEPPVFQCVQVKPLGGNNGERFRCVFSDIQNFIQSMLASQLNHLVKEDKLKRGVFVRINNYSLNEVKGKRIMVVLECEVLEQYPLMDKIGNPESLESSGGPLKQEDEHKPEPPSNIPSNNFYGSKPQEPPQSKTQPQKTHGNQSIYPIEAISPKPYDKRELTLVDNTGYSVRLTIWGNAAQSFDVREESVIAFKGVKVSDFGGRSLSLLSSGSMTVDPDIDEAHKLKGWYDAQGRTDTFNSHAAIMGTTGASGRKDEYKTISAVKDEQLGMSEQTDYFTLKATVIYVKSDNIAYPACQTSDCNKKVIETQPGEWRCERCDKSFESPQYRYIMQANVSDFSGQIWVSCFDDVGKLIMGMSADELITLKDSGDEKTYTNKIAEANCQTWIFRCRAKMDTFQDQQRYPQLHLSTSRKKQTAWQRSSSNMTLETIVCSCLDEVKDVYEAHNLALGLIILQPAMCLSNVVPTRHSINPGIELLVDSWQHHCLENVPEYRLVLWRPASQSAALESDPLSHKRGDVDALWKLRAAQRRQLNDTTVPCKHIQILLKVRRSHIIDNEINTVSAICLNDLLLPVLAVSLRIDSLVRAQLLLDDLALVILPRRSKHLGRLEPAARLAQLNSSDRDRRQPRMPQHSLVRRGMEAADEVQHLQRRHPRLAHAGCRRPAPRRRLVQQHALVHAHELGVAAAVRQPEDGVAALPRVRVCRLRAHLLDRARKLEAHDGRGPGGHRVFAFALEGVGAVEAEGLHADQALGRAGLRLVGRGVDEEGVDAAFAAFDICGYRC
ncbi:hypothetical protein FH972_023370 [Carpinus fangiana]|uniref:Replication protein A subunit n=1 Tax=Carpinus fangiana TaxID=176857 RepID=A0A5N6KV05_9ROSI|nr:hypothetical protein FH972_023370 [Carpinus fangiana]